MNNQELKNTVRSITEPCEDCKGTGQDIIGKTKLGIEVRDCRVCKGKG